MNFFTRNLLMMFTSMVCLRIKTENKTQNKKDNKDPHISFRFRFVQIRSDSFRFVQIRLDAPMFCCHTYPMMRMHCHMFAKFIVFGMCHERFGRETVLTVFGISYRIIGFFRGVKRFITPFGQGFIVFSIRSSIKKTK
jgi:hypothetical protein